MVYLLGLLWFCYLKLCLNLLMCLDGIFFILIILFSSDLSWMWFSMLITLFFLMIGYLAGVWYSFTLFLLIYSCFVASCNDCVLDSTLGNSGIKFCSSVSLSLSKKSKLFMKFCSYGYMGLWTSFWSSFSKSIRFKGEITLGWSSQAYILVSIYTYVWILCSDFFLNIFARKFLNPRCCPLDCYLDCCYC